MPAIRRFSALLLIAAACAEPPAPAPPPVAEGFEPRPTRGYILISLDTLRADHLSAYGYERPTSPFLERLAEGSVLFERVAVQYPATLIAHMSMFTGYYPQQHGVFPPAAVLAESIETLPERFRAAGFRTAGHTEGGFVGGAYGFARGFEEWSDTPYSDDTDIVRTFERGLDFIAGLEPDERFFVFLHTYSIHDPYLPPSEFRHVFWEGEPPDTFEPDGPNLNAVNKGFLDIDAETARYFEALYDGSILYVDGVLERFFAQLEDLGVADDTTVVITSDHGEEFLDHGKMGHEQIYPEGILVPLVVRHPDLDRPIRIPALVEGIDLPATLLELAGLESFADRPGLSLVPYFRDPGIELADEAYAEVVFPQTQKSLLREQDGTVYQLVLSEQLPEPDGTWIPRRVEADIAAERLDLRLISFEKPRRLTVSIDGETIEEVEIPNRWTPLVIDLPPGPEPGGAQRVTFATSDCESPERLEGSHDSRCLAIKVQGVGLRRHELFDLGADPGAEHDIYRQRERLRRTLHDRLRRYRWEPVAESSQRALDNETRRTLEALGYLQ
ncbi:MAG: sulfatase [Thermoanaerobaculia bacterium]|nr:sulfatase [Thermoanaerobaculia bacterium]